MAVGRRCQGREQALFVRADQLPRSPAHPFYEKLNEVLASEEFDAKVESWAAPYYAEKMGRPSLPPGVYFRMLLVGFFEGLTSERAIAWRCADSLVLRRFLGYELTERTPDHSTLSGTRRRLPLEWHRRVFALVTAILEKYGLLKGSTFGVDATTLEANAAMSSIVRRDTGQGYRQYLGELAKASGVATPTAGELARFDRQRRGKRVSNREWVSRTDPEAKIARMKDGRTRLAYKAENAVDLETEAIVSAEIHPADLGDTETGPQTLDEAQMVLCQVKEEVPEFATSRSEVVTDKGYFSGALVAHLAANGYRSYIPEPRRRGPRRRVGRGDTQRALRANRRRLRGARYRRLARRRAEVTERIHTQLLDLGGLRRTRLRGRANVAKRYLAQAAAYNLSLVMRKTVGVGKPRAFAALAAALWRALCCLIARFLTRLVRRAPAESVVAGQRAVYRGSHHHRALPRAQAPERSCSTGS